MYRLIRSEILQKLNPAPDALLDALAEIVDDSMLEEIASADYGMEVEAHLAQLYRIRDDHKALFPIGWNPREVLQLTRWSEPDRFYPVQSEKHRREHILRAFACAALLWTTLEPSNQDYEEGQNQTLVQLLTSLMVLGDPFQVPALRFIAWCAQNVTDYYEEGPFYIITLLVLILRTHADLTTNELQEIIDYLYSIEQQIGDARKVNSAYSDRWLLRLTSFDQRHKVWKQIGDEIGTLAINYKDSNIELFLGDIASRLTNESTG
jgi:hypothetical protein